MMHNRGLNVNLHAPYNKNEDYSFETGASYSQSDRSFAPWLHRSLGGGRVAGREFLQTSENMWAPSSAALGVFHCGDNRWRDNGFIHPWCWMPPPPHPAHRRPSHRASSMYIILLIAVAAGVSAAGTDARGIRRGGDRGVALDDAMLVGRPRDHSLYLGDVNTLYCCICDVICRIRPGTGPGPRCTPAPVWNGPSWGPRLHPPCDRCEQHTCQPYHHESCGRES